MKFRHTCMIGAGWLAMAATAPADIVWSGEQNLSTYEQPIDLNGDTFTDVIFTYEITSNNSLMPVAHNGFIDALIGEGYGISGSNRILVNSSNMLDAALPFGTPISNTPAPTRVWASGRYFAGSVSSWSTLPPPDTQWRGLLGENGNTYVGIAFEVEDATHYGWINVALGPDLYEGFAVPIIASWAYESTPDTPIMAGAIPEPSSGILAFIGAFALLMRARARCRS